MKITGALHHIYPTRYNPQQPKSNREQCISYYIHITETSM